LVVMVGIPVCSTSFISIFFLHILFIFYLKTSKNGKTRMNTKFLCSKQQEKVTMLLQSAGAKEKYIQWIKTCTSHPQIGTVLLCVATKGWKCMKKWLVWSYQEISRGIPVKRTK
jgi:hypothetical protein